MESFGAGTAYRSPIEPGACPHCGQRETVERVASLVTGGMTPIISTIGRMPIVLGTGRSYGMTPRNSGGTGTGGLPAYLLPPREPQGLRYGVTRTLAAIAILGVVGAVPFAIGIVPAITRITIGDSLPTLPFALIGAVLIAVAFLVAGWGVVQIVSGRARRHVQGETVAYKRAMERWSHLSFCTDCHCVFAAGTDECIPHRRIRAYLSA